MGRESDRIGSQIGCLRTLNIPAALISTSGFHCEVWHAAGAVLRGGVRRELDFVIKVSRSPCTLPEVRALAREHAQLRSLLEEMIPPTVFVATRIAEQNSVLALAGAVGRWFDVGNPSNEVEAVPLFRRLHRARDQLRRFVEVALELHRREQKVIDLYGVENLVLDRRQRLHYVDSFRVFFHEDLLHALDDPDPGLAHRISVSRMRLEYLQHLLREATPAS